MGKSFTRSKFFPPDKTLGMCSNFWQHKLIALEFIQHKTQKKYLDIVYKMSESLTLTTIIS